MGGNSSFIFSNKFTRQFSLIHWYNDVSRSERHMRVVYFKYLSIRLGKKTDTIFLLQNSVIFYTLYIQTVYSILKKKKCD